VKTILIPYHDEEAARVALKTGVLLASHFGSYVEGLLVFGEPIISFVPGTVVEPQYLSRAGAEWRRYAARIRKEFMEVTAAGGLPFAEFAAAGPGPAAGWSEMRGDEAEIVGQRGRVFDLIVVSRPSSASSRWREIHEAALFESARPVLVAPAEIPETVGTSILIAWNGTPETARTVALGMPLLKAADRVEVLSVEDIHMQSPPAAAVVAFLAWHGISATSRTLQPDERPTGEIILDEAGDIGADLIFKGAFTRSRLRQIVFGGTTQHILDYARIPVLLAH
jgi:nucleotide-binding universal stress UspA family protein